MKTEMIKENGRTHEPSHRELVAELDGLREFLLEKIGSIRTVVDERDKLYSERDRSNRTAVEAALSAVKDQTNAAFASSEKAIVKQEHAQTAYNVVHNDLARKMDEQNKATMPRMETESRFVAIEEKISDLRESRSGVIGKGVGIRELIGYIIAIGTFVYLFVKG